MKVRAKILIDIETESIDSESIIRILLYCLGENMSNVPAHTIHDLIIDYERI